jgi:hypothetical protein
LKEREGGEREKKRETIKTKKEGRGKRRRQEGNPRSFIHLFIEQMFIVYCILCSTITYNTKKGRQSSSPDGTYTNIQFTFRE